MLLGVHFQVHVTAPCKSRWNGSFVCLTDHGQIMASHTLSRLDSWARLRLQGWASIDLGLDGKCGLTLACTARFDIPLSA